MKEGVTRLTGTAHILIVDDDYVTRLLLKKILASEPGFRVTEACNGIEAWELLDEGLTPDLCIFDLMMPQGGGFDLLKNVRSSRRLRNVGVILCSSLNDRGSVERAATLTPDFYVLKPFQREYLLDRVRRTLNRKPPKSPWEDEIQTRERLGMDEQTHRACLRVLIDQIRRACARLRQGLSDGGLDDVEILFNAVKGAAAMLGAHPIVDRIGAVQADLHPLHELSKEPEANSTQAAQSRRLASLRQSLDFLEADAESALSSALLQGSREPSDL
jgi:two-component system chemotaxis response regulator CheY